MFKLQYCFEVCEMELSILHKTISYSYYLTRHGLTVKSFSFWISTPLEKIVAIT